MNAASATPHEFSLVDPVPEFFGHKLRILTDELNHNAPWFAASDIMKALDLSIGGVSATYKRLFAEEKSYLDRITVGMKPGRPVLLVAESGFYKLVMRSRKPEASAFQHWVCSEVLPSIRRHGQYTAYADDAGNPVDVPDVMVEMVALTKRLPSGDISETAPRLHVWEYVLDKNLDFTRNHSIALGKIARRLMVTYDLPILQTWRTARRYHWKEMKFHNSGVYPEAILDMAYQEFLAGRNQ